MTAYPLDVAKQSIWHQIVNQPLPARPEGFFLSPKLYRASLHPLTPLTIGFFYICAVFWANNRNRLSQDGKKDFINSSPTLKNLVLTHNLFLAIYSLWTCANVVVRLLAYFAKGFQEGGLEGLTCAYCTVPTHDADRDGLLRYMVLFYYSKFYEVIDSVVLAAKGKKISNLQVYHHAGAMLTMYAGVAYSASPIWIFASWNGFVHTWMYFFYGATSLKLAVPSIVKRSITTLQIAQLFFGMLVASSFLFITYKPTSFSHHIRPSVGIAHYHTAWDEAASMLSGNSSALTSPSILGSPMSTRYIDSRIASSINTNGRAPCLSSTGHTFATILNVAYLIPLIFLFVNFYVNSYLKKRALTEKKQL